MKGRYVFIIKYFIKQSFEVNNKIFFSFNLVPQYQRTYISDILTMLDTKMDVSDRSGSVSRVTAKEEIQDNKPSFCYLLKTWAIYYITLTFALLAIFR